MDHPLLLIADNDRDDRFFLRRAMARLQVLNPIREVETGQEVLDYLEGNGRFSSRAHYPVASILLLDVHIPEISGFDVLRWIRQRKPSGLQCVLVWTGTSSPAERLAMREYGVACTDKPMTLAGYERLLNNFHGLRLERLGHGRVFSVAPPPRPNPPGIIEITASARYPTLRES